MFNTDDQQFEITLTDPEQHWEIGHAVTGVKQTLAVKYKPNRKILNKRGKRIIKKPTGILFQKVHFTQTGTSDVDLTYYEAWQIKDGRSSFSLVDKFTTEMGLGQLAGTRSYITCLWFIDEGKIKLSGLKQRAHKCAGGLWASTEEPEVGFRMSSANGPVYTRKLSFSWPTPTAKKYRVKIGRWSMKAAEISQAKKQKSTAAEGARRDKEFEQIQRANARKQKAKAKKQKRQIR